MDLNNLSLAYQVAYLQPFIEGAFVNKIQQVGPKALRLKLHSKQGAHDMLITKEAIYFTQYKIQALEKPSNFVEFLKKRLLNQRVHAFHQHEAERVVVFAFNEYYLIAELFSKGNMILCDKKWNILQPFERQEWGSRIIERNKPYAFPKAGLCNPFNVTLMQLKSIFSATSNDLVHSLIHDMNVIPFVAEQICMDCNLPKNSPAGALSDASVRALHERIQFYYALPNPTRMNATLVEDRGKTVLLPFPLNRGSTLSQKNFSTLNEALDLHLTPLLNAQPLPGTKESIEKPNAKVLALQKSMAQQEEALKKFETLEKENKEKAQYIQSHLAELHAAMERTKDLHAQKMPDKKALETLKKEFPFVNSMDLKHKKIVVETE